MKTNNIFAPVKQELLTAHLNIHISKELHLELKKGADKFHLPIGQFIEQGLRFALASMKEI